VTDITPVHATERLIIRRGSFFAEMSVDSYEPDQHQATVFCLHDYLGNSRDFRQLGAVLAAHRYRVVCPDMFGRGDSAYLDDPKLYLPATLLFALMAVMQRFADRRIIIVGKGWGALLALLLNVKLTFDLERLIIADAPLLNSSQGDRLSETAQIEFDTLDEARHSILASSEFAGIPEPTASALAEGRVRRSEGGRFALRLDPALVHRLTRLRDRDRSVNAVGLLERVKSSVLYLSADMLSEHERRILRAAMVSPLSALADGLAPGGRVHFNFAHQQLLVLGFLESRLISGD
jgi:pimeloyl-ACP methyl ester carboxylesterase